ncbi:unnamed protein product [Closterium sp. Naga37s-1]|nr:unnamed protein product [Closterium sp. Naga37s-1]
MADGTYQTRVNYKPTQKPHLSVCSPFSASLSLRPSMLDTPHTLLPRVLPPGLEDGQVSADDWLGAGASAARRGLLVAVCSAATKSSVVFQVDSIFSPHSPTSPPAPRLSSPLLPPVLPPLSFVSGSAGGGSAGGGVFCGHQELSRLHSHQPAREGTVHSPSLYLYGGASEIDLTLNKLLADDVPKKKPDPTIYKIAAHVRSQRR